MLRIPSTRARPEPVASKQWTVGEMARQTKCTLRTIRFYEQQGLLSVKERTGGHHRRYSSHEFDRLCAIIELRRAGLSLEEIRFIIEVKRRNATGALASYEFRRLLETQILAIHERLTQLLHTKGELERLHEVLLGCEDCHCNPHFPNSCAKCEKSSAAATDESLLRALWSHSR